MATKTTKTTAKPATKAKGRRQNIGSVWQNQKNPNFMGGTLKPASGQYMNSQWVLDQLGEPTEGMQWRLKVFFKTREHEDYEDGQLIGDIVIEEEPIYQG